MGLSVFLDWFGVVADSDVMTSRWRRVEARLLQQRYGGSLSRWTRVHDRAFRWYVNYWSRHGPNTRKSFRQLWKYSETEWMYRTLKWGGTQPPRSKAKLFHLDRTLTYGITRRIDPTYPFARRTLKTLSQAGNRLFLVSGADSTYVQGALEATRLGRFFDETFSPDQLNAFKGSPSYWRKVLKLSRSGPETSLVVDDRRKFLRIPAQFGITPVLVSPRNPRNHKFLHIESIRELPRVLGLAFAKS